MVLMIILNLINFTQQPHTAGWSQPATTRSTAIWSDRKIIIKISNSVSGKSIRIGVEVRVGNVVGHLGMLLRQGRQDLWFPNLVESVGPNVHDLVILLNLPGQFLKHFPGKLNSIVPKFAELHKLHKISISFPTLAVHKLTVVIVKLIHDIEGPIANAHNDDADGQVTALH